ncbi:MAG TPA: ATP-binding protein [Nostocaceae cyanobacterium]|nr:ATP-binding protein [Nostocaceae cyanobacterium]
MLAMHSMKYTDELNLELDSTLQQLPVWTTQMELSCPGSDLAKVFEQEPLLPGVILTRDQQCKCMISRRLFFEQMSRPYGLGLFAGRPIEYLYNFIQPEIFILSEDTKIVDATQAALARDPRQVYEPIIVESSSLKHGLLDFHQLLLAYSRIYVLTIERLQHEKERARKAKAGFRDLQHNYTRLLQNEKMAALGQLVAGIAHEINNPISFIYGNLTHATQYVEDLLNVLKTYQENYPQPEAKIKKLINEIELDFIVEDLPKLLSSMMAGSTRIREIVLSLRNFSRLDEAEIKVVDIHEGIDNTLIILQNHLKAKPNRPEIAVIKEYGELPLIECYAGQLNQVFMNILTNSIDALSESYQLSIFSGDLAGKMRKNLTIRIQTKFSDDNHVIIRFEDNGPGIPESIQKRLFDPFFTTKPVGKGTGLGLSISHQIIVEKHGGQIHCISEHGKGAEFVIKIPVKIDQTKPKIIN